MADGGGFVRMMGLNGNSTLIPASMAAGAMLPARSSGGTSGTLGSGRSMDLSSENPSSRTTWGLHMLADAVQETDHTGAPGAALF